MRVTNLKPALVSVCSALLASLCCLLPLAVMILGLGSGAFMALTMRYQAILLPLGILGVTVGYVLYLRERRRCRSLACTMAGSRLNLVALLIATLVIVGELALVVFPGAASTLFTHAMVVAADRPERFAAQGSIVAVDDEKHTVTIAHGDIPELMSPMTMVFPVASPELLTGIVPGDRLQFHLLRTPTSLMVVELAKDVSAGEAQLIFDVRGMTWASWPLLVQQALEGLPGVKHAEVSFAQQQAIVQYEMGKVDAAQMIAAIQRIGFATSLQ